MLRQVREVPPRKYGYGAREPWFAKDVRDFLQMGYETAELLPPEGVAKAKSWAASTARSVNSYAKKKGLPVLATKRKDIVYIERKEEGGVDGVEADGRMLLERQNEEGEDA